MDSSTSFTSTRTIGNGGTRHTSNSNNSQSDNQGAHYSEGSKRDPSKKDAMLRYRQGSPGYWTVALLPLAIYFADRKFNNQSFTAVLIIGFNSILLSFFHSFSFNIPRILESLKSLNACLSVLTLCYCYLNNGILYEYASYVALNFSFPYLFQNFIKNYPHSFTFGEGMIVTSAFAYNFWVTSQSLPFPPAVFQETPEPIIVSMFVQMAFFGTLLLARVFLVISKPWKFFALEEMYCLWAKCVFGAFVFRLSNPADDIWFLIYWAVGFLFGRSSRLIFLGWWTVCVGLAAFFLTTINSQREVTTTVDRKFFHLLISVVYFPAIFNDFNLIYFCSAIVLFGYLLVEAIRALKFELFGINFGEIIDSAVHRFRDDRDGGRLILTPIYLLAGCSLPIWLTGLYYENPNNNLSPEEMAAALTGVLSIGVGDTVASVVGSNYGRIRWPGSNKTVEGTVCSMLSQILTILLFSAMGAIPVSTLSVTALCISSVINAMVEARTDQIDNLVVPLTAFNTVHGIFIFHEKYLS